MVGPKRMLARLAAMTPALVSAASDNDPTTVASLAVIGSTTVFGLAWLVLLIIPMLAVVQAISTQVGAVGEQGLAGIVRLRYGLAVTWVLLVAVLCVNLLTLAADLEGGGAALHLLTETDYRWWIAPLALTGCALLIFGSYRRVERVLFYLPLAFVTYVVAAFLAHPNWGEVLRDSFVPHYVHSSAYIAGAIALLGTTLTAYAYLWQGIEISHERPPLRRIARLKGDATIGAAAAGLTFWFIVVATGATLGVAHHPVQTAEQAAQALAPAAGHAAALLFGIGLLGSSLLAVPVLLATSAYVIAELFGWRAHLDAAFENAPRFYATMIAVGVCSTAIAFAGIAPIRLLFISSIAGGIATPITLVALLLVAGDRRVMERRRPSRTLLCCGWVVTAIVSAAAALYLWTTFL